MQLAYLIAVICSYSTLLNAEQGPVDFVAEKLTGSAIVGAVVIAFAWWSSQMRLYATGTIKWFQCARRLDKLHASIYLIYVACIVLLFDFVAIIHSHWRLSSIVWGDDLALMAALTVPLLVSWAIIVGGGEALRSGTYLRWLAIGKRVAVQSRHLLVMPLLPILLVTGITDSLRLFGPASLQSWEGPICGMAMIAFVVVTPWVVRHCWPTERLRYGVRRRAIDRLVEKSNVRVAEVLRWKTDGLMANAAIAGLQAHFRYLFLTDVMLDQLSVRQILSITAHELGHCISHHLRRLFVSVLFLSAGLTLCLQLSADQSFFLTTMVVGGWGALWLRMHMAWARLLELEADLTGCRLLSDVGQLEAVWIERFVHALQRLRPNANGDWLHPSPADRASHLWRLLPDPSLVERFHERLRRLAWSQTIASIILMLIAFAIG